MAVALLFGACSKDPQVESREYFQSAQQHARAGRVPEAIVQYRNAIAVDPRYGEARLQLGRLLEKQGDLNGAAGEFVRAADLLPSNRDAQLGAARIYLASAKYEDAATRADKVLAIDPKSIDALIVKGSALAGQRRYDDAIDEIESAIALDPSRSQSYGNLGVVQFARGHKPEAETALKRAIDVAPAQAEPYIALAGFYLATGQAALAEQTLSRALQSQPRHPAVNRGLAALLLATGRVNQAEGPLKIVAEEQKDVRSELTLADYYHMVRRDDDALKVLDRTAAGEGFGAAMARKATIFRLRGDSSRAYATVEAVLQKEPRNSSALVLKAAFLTEDGKLDAAMSTVESAVKVQPNAADVQFALGRIHQLRGNASAARNAYLEVVRLRPRHAEALLGLAQLAVVGLQPADAQRYVQDALRIRPDYPDAQLLQARLDMQSGKRREAEDTLRRLAMRYPRSAAVPSLLGTLYLAHKEEPAARKAFEHSLSLDPLTLEAIGGLVEMDLKSGKSAPALARVDKAVASSPRSAGHLNPCCTNARRHREPGQGRGVAARRHRRRPLAPDRLRPARTAVQSRRRNSTRRSRSSIRHPVNQTQWAHQRWSGCCSSSRTRFRRPGPAMSV